MLKITMPINIATFPQQFSRKNFEQGDHGPLRIAYAIHQLNYSVLGFGKNDHKHIKRKLTCYLEYIQTSTPQHIAACFST